MALTRFDENDYLWDNINPLNHYEKWDDEIRGRYKQVGDRISYSNSKAIYDEYNKQIPLNKINKVLSTIESHTLHKKFRRGPKNISYSRYKRYQFQLDLCFLLNLAPHNDDVKYLLTVIDTFTRYAFVRPLKDKKSQSVLLAFRDILIEAGQNPKMIVCDRGSEFVNRDFQLFCLQQKINLINPKSNVHASYVERFNQTLQGIIMKYLTEFSTNKYIDKLPEIVRSYNLRHHRMIGMSPHEAETNPNAQLIINKKIAKNESKIRKSKPSLSIGDTVRISKDKTKFSRGFNEQAQKQIFKIDRIDTDKRIPLYHLTNIDGIQNDFIIGGFYRNELTPTNITTYRIERILARRRIRGVMHVLVKWEGYDDIYNQWIKESDLVDIV